MQFIDTDSLEERILHELEKANLLSCNQILSISDIDIRRKCCLSVDDIKLIKQTAAKSLIQRDFKRVPEADCFNNLHITFDCEVLNQLLGGGLPVGGITELSGESGAGKTQICLQLSLTVQYPVQHGGLGKGAVYICTEDKFPTNRLNQMFEHFPRSDSVKILMRNTILGDHILVDHIAEVDGLKECLYSRLPKLLSRSQIGLVVLDSIAGVYRADYTFREGVKRAKDIRDVGLQLLKISRKYNVAVICVNQVSDSIDDSGTKIPALGLCWANLVTTRLQAHRYPQRALQVVSSPAVPSGISYYRITNSGVYGLCEPENCDNLDSE